MLRVLLDAGELVQRGSDVRRPPPEAFAEAERRNLAIARKRRELQGRLTAEIAEGEAIGDLHWYALTVAPGHEGIAAAHLSARRFGIYRPTYDEMVWSGGAYRFRQRPILPGYLFISSIGLIGRWRRALACPGVIAFVNRAGTDTPARLPQRFIEELRTEEWTENSRLELIHGYTPGASYAVRKKKSRKARRSFKLRRGRRAQAALTSRLP